MTSEELSKTYYNCFIVCVILWANCLIKKLSKNPPIQVNLNLIPPV